MHSPAANLFPFHALCLLGPERDLDPQNPVRSLVLVVRADKPDSRLVMRVGTKRAFEQPSNVTFETPLATLRHLGTLFVAWTHDDGPEHGWVRYQGPGPYINATPTAIVTNVADPLEKFTVPIFGWLNGPKTHFFGYEEAVDVSDTLRRFGGSGGREQGGTITLIAPPSAPYIHNPPVVQPLRTVVPDEEAA